jgi:hypothetical protein
MFLKEIVAAISFFCLKGHFCFSFGQELMVNILFQIDANNALDIC